MSTCKVGQKLGGILYLSICSFLPCLSWLLRSRVRKSRRDLWITLYSFNSHDVILTCYQHWKLCFSAFTCFNDQCSPVEINVLWNAKVCSLIGRYQCFCGTKCLCPQGRKFLLNFGVQVPNYIVAHSGRQQSWVATMRASNSHRFPVIILNIGLYVKNFPCNMMRIFNICWRICHTSLWSGTCLLLNGSVHFVKLNIYLLI